MGGSALSPDAGGGEGGGMCSPFVYPCGSRTAVRGESTELIVRQVGEIICKGTQRLRDYGTRGLRDWCSRGFLVSLRFPPSLFRAILLWTLDSVIR